MLVACNLQPLAAGHHQLSDQKKEEGVEGKNQQEPVGKKTELNPSSHHLSLATDFLLISCVCSCMHFRSHLHIRLLLPPAVSQQSSRLCFEGEDSGRSGGLAHQLVETQEVPTVTDVSGPR